MEKEKTAMDETMLEGTVLFLSPKLGYGFIQKDDGSGDIFLHYSNVEMDGFKTLTAGQRVSYQVGFNHKGPQAIKVKAL